jgi:hypothetical protein
MARVERRFAGRLPIVFGCTRSLSYAPPPPHLAMCLLAAGAENAKVGVRLVDFAHTFQSGEEDQPDENFIAGLRSLCMRLQNVVVRGESHDNLQHS